MRGFTNLGLCLLVSFSLSLLCLIANFLYCICRRRREQRLAGDAELGCKVSSFKLPALHFLCHRIQSRVEPSRESPVICNPADEPVKISQPEAENEECSLSKWREQVFGPSRVLYTIKEEEEREGVESDREKVPGSGGVGGIESAEVEEDILFTTPCFSPAFYTPCSSPSRAPENEAAVAVCVSLAAARASAFRTE